MLRGNGHFASTLCRVFALGTTPTSSETASTCTASSAHCRWTAASPSICPRSISSARIVGRRSTRRNWGPTCVCTREARTPTMESRTPTLDEAILSRHTSANWVEQWSVTTVVRTIKTIGRSYHDPPSWSTWGLIFRRGRASGNSIGEAASQFSGIAQRIVARPRSQRTRTVIREALARG